MNSFGKNWENIYHKAGYEVLLCNSFQKPVLVCEAEHPDLLVLDLDFRESVDLHFVKEIQKEKAAFYSLC